MAVAKLAEKFDGCMHNSAHVMDDCVGCPLMKNLKLEVGAEGDEHGSIVWSIQACSLMAILDDQLKKGARQKK